MTRASTVSINPNLDIPPDARLALKAARRSDHKAFFVGAIALRGGAIVGVGYNHGTKHAEVKCLQAIWPSKRKGLTVWCIRLTRSGLLRMSKPCPECREYLRKNGVKTVYYSDEVGSIQRLMEF